MRGAGAIVAAGTSGGATGAGAAIEAVRGAGARRRLGVHAAALSISLVNPAAAVAVRVSARAVAERRRSSAPAKAGDAGGASAGAATGARRGAGATGATRGARGQERAREPAVRELEQQPGVGPALPARHVVRCQQPQVGAEHPSAALPDIPGERGSTGARSTRQVGAEANACLPAGGLRWSWPRWWPSWVCARHTVPAVAPSC